MIVELLFLPFVGMWYVAQYALYAVAAVTIGPFWLIWVYFQEREKNKV